MIDSNIDCLNSDVMGLYVAIKDKFYGVFIVYDSDYIYNLIFKHTNFAKNWFSALQEHPWINEF